MIRKTNGVTGEVTMVPTPKDPIESVVEEPMTEEELEAEGDWDENPEKPFEIEMQ